MGIIYGLHSGDGVIRYVGQTKQGVAGRLRDHLKSVAKSSQLKAHQWIRECGPEAIRIEVLEETDELDQAEKNWIHWAREICSENLNVSPGGYHDPMASEVSRQKVSTANLGRTLTLETREKMGAYPPWS